MQDRFDVVSREILRFDLKDGKKKQVFEKMKEFENNFFEIILLVIHLNEENFKSH